MAFTILGSWVVLQIVKRTSAMVGSMSAFGGKADIAE